jgi:hypothetical protein
MLRIRCKIATQTPCSSENAAQMLCNRLKIALQSYYFDDEEIATRLQSEFEAIAKRF